MPGTLSRVLVGPHPQSLSLRQREVLDRVMDYYGVVREPCPAAWIARRLAISRVVALSYFGTLHRKGWLETAHSPAVPRPWLLQGGLHQRS